MSITKYMTVATQSEDFSIEDTVLLTGNEPSCLQLRVVNDNALENDEMIVFTVFASMDDVEVIVISPEYNQSIITLSNDDSK